MLDYAPNPSSFHSDVKTGGGESHSAQGTRTSTLRTSAREIKLENIRYVPTLKKNLASVGTITDSGHVVLFTKTHCWIHNDGQVLAIGHRDKQNGLYFLKEQPEEALSMETCDIVDLWHRRLGHLSYSGLSYLSRSTHIARLPCINVHSRICMSCLEGRQHRERFPKKSETRAQHPGERIHTWTL